MFAKERLSSSSSAARPGVTNGLAHFSWPVFLTCYDGEVKRLTAAPLAISWGSVNGTLSRLSPCGRLFVYFSFIHPPILSVLGSWFHFYSDFQIMEISPAVWMWSPVLSPRFLPSVLGVLSPSFSQYTSYSLQSSRHPSFPGRWRSTDSTLSIVKQKWGGERRWLAKTEEEKRKKKRVPTADGQDACGNFHRAKV